MPIKQKILHETATRARERAVLVGLSLPGHTRQASESSLEELAQLADTAGADVIETVLHARPKIDPAYFIGQGKADFIAALVTQQDIDVVIFDDDLSPGQAANLERLFDTKVLDRSGLILDIFARRARTREARTQVELAQLEYLLPRLAGQWTHFTRHAGGIGLRGPGETQLETDRRIVRQRIAHLTKELQKIERQRAVRRQHREGVFKVALVGYTNAGKSTLLNALTEAQVLVENRLFATLDPTVRALRNESNGFHKDVGEILLIDTVGFIRKLPHDLVASFKSTLEEACEAELLLHVIDVTHPDFEQHIKTVREVLNELELGEYPVLHVFNKVDALHEPGLITRLRNEYAPAVMISAERKMFLHELQERIVEFATANVVEFEAELPIAEPALLARIHRMANVLERRFEDDRVIVKLRARQPEADQIRHFLNFHPLPA
ncbi:GTPase HflX [candidate division KSB1 bacterium]|nr:GTPase HflX [candidate division KSB1 bacterium]